MRQVINQMTMKFESRSVNEGFARMATAVFVSQLDPTLEEISDVKTIVSEAVTNAIVHGYKDHCGQIHITAKLFDDQTAEIRVRDQGCGIADVRKAREPMFTTGNDERSGMGFTIMESFSDKLRVRSAVGKGTTVILVKKIAGKLYDNGKN